MHFETDYLNLLCNQVYEIFAHGGETLLDRNLTTFPHLRTLSALFNPIKRQRKWFKVRSYPVILKRQYIVSDHLIPAWATPLAQWTNASCGIFLVGHLHSSHITTRRYQMLWQWGIFMNGPQPELQWMVQCVLVCVCFCTAVLVRVWWQSHCCSHSYGSRVVTGI